jgi:hypothetical protein
MLLEFDRRSNTDIIRDKQSVARGFLHNHRPCFIYAATARLAAERYLRKYCRRLELSRSQLRALDLQPEDKPIDRGVEFRFLSEKHQFNVTTVTFCQTGLGVPVWQAGISVHLKNEMLPAQSRKGFLFWLRLIIFRYAQPKCFRVICCQITRHAELAVDALKPTAAALERLENLDSQALVRQLGLEGKEGPLAVEFLRIRRPNLMIYRHDAAKRVLAEGNENPLALSLPAVPINIDDADHYFIAAFYFDLKLNGLAPVHWVALVEAATLCVLYVEPLAGCVNGMVFLADPMTTHAGPPADADNAQLNPCRVSVLLHGLDDNANPRRLVGPNVKICDFELPRNRVPEVPPDPCFEFDARTDQFAAVNAYYHCDRFFRLVEDLGFRRADYFPGTSFPTLVDPRGTPNNGYGPITGPNSVNAQCRMKTSSLPHNSVSGGIDRTIFCLAETNRTPQIGNASDWRVALHELGGHGTLCNHVNSTYLGFAHSAGDSLAAILNDPESNAPDKGCTFPWTQFPVPRRHDRMVQDGWGWDGYNDQNDSWPYYKREQILSSTHFRLYKSLGGGDLGQQADVRLFAARFTAYLVLRAILSLTPVTNPQHASDWLCNLLVADAEDWTSEGHSGGAYEKVIRWAFEKQGLFGGRPPDVDVYIEDGRGGEYYYQQSDYDCPAIWNRLKNDGLEVHQTPVLHVINYAYVKIKNRGTQVGKSVIVKAFQSKPQRRRVYPHDWQPMKIPTRSAADVPPNSQQEIKAGPFEWIPTHIDNAFVLMAASAEGDPNNLSKFRAGTPISDWRLVPNDNNLGMRKV